MANINDVLEGHVALEIECVDRLLLNAYVPRLQVPGQVVRFLCGHLGHPIPSPALLGKIGDRFRAETRRFARDRGIPVLQLASPDRSRWDDRKLDHVRPHLEAAEREGRFGVVAVVVAEEFQRVWIARNRSEKPGVASLDFFWQKRRVGAYYFYILDPEFGPAFIKICTYGPVVREGLGQRARVGQTPSRPRRGSRSRRCPTGSRPAIGARTVAGDLRQLRPRARAGVLRSLDHPDPDAAHHRGSCCRVLVGALDAPGRDVPHDRVRRPAPRTIVLRSAWCRTTSGSAAPKKSRWSSPDSCRRPTQHRYQTRIFTTGTEIRIDFRYKHSRVKQYLKDGRALRIETVINRPDDLDVKRRLQHLPELIDKARAVNQRLLMIEQAGQSCAIGSALFERIHQPYHQEGQRTGALRFGDERATALAGALCTVLGAVTGFQNKSLRPLVAGHLDQPYTQSKMSYDLRRLRLHGLIQRIPRKNTYVLTPDGIRVAVFYTKLRNRLLRPLLDADKPPAKTEIRQALRTLENAVADYIQTARLAPAK